MRQTSLILYNVYFRFQHKDNEERRVSFCKKILGKVEVEVEGKTIWIVI